MIPELGHFALILALLLAIVQAVVPLIGAARNDAEWMAMSRPAAVGQFAMITVAFLALMYAFVVSDFTVANVVENSHSAKPMLYKVAGVWGNHEGSMVLWVLILALFGAMVALFGSNLPPHLQARVLSVQAMIGVGFLAFILATSNPFLRVDPPPLNGQDLNPLLQDPGLAFHPPFLYFGYVGFSMAFSFAVAALIEGRVDAAWARWVRPWTLAAWCALTVGIALGSWWAYYELGWGGWWFWDPVENASFMPWLTGTALLHSAIVVEKRDTLKSWTILLAILTFGLSLLGTFLVRSGILTSVHAFAVDPQRGVFILGLLGLTIGGSLTLYAIRAPGLKGGGLFAPISREGGLVLNNALLSIAAFVVVFGTLFPIAAQSMGFKVSVGAPYFNIVFLPFAAALVSVMALGPMLAWKRGNLASALRRLKMAAMAVTIIMLIVSVVYGTRPILAVAGMGLAAWAFFGALAEFTQRIQLFRLSWPESWRRAKGLPRSAWGGTIAHAGMGITIAGMVATSAWKSERIESLAPGDSITVAGYEVTFDGVGSVEGPNYVAERGALTVRRDGDLVTVLEPEKRWYPVARMPTTEAAIRTTGTADLYTAIGDGPDELGRWVVRVWHHPLVPWIWAGAIIMALGGLVSLSDRRLRVGAPTRARQATAPPHPQPAE